MSPMQRTFSASRMRSVALAGMIATTVVCVGLLRLANPTPAVPPPSALTPASPQPVSPAGRYPIQLCQALSPAAPHSIWAVDSAKGDACSEVGWDARGCAPWQSFAQGEYVGHHRLAHVPEYRLRVDDTLSVFFLRTRAVQPRSYSIQVGDILQVESLTAGSSVSTGQTSGKDDSLNRQVSVQPDGTIKLPLVNRVAAAGRTIESLQNDLEARYKKHYRVPTITVSPVRVNTRLEDLLETVDARGAINGGRQLSAVVTPAGKIQLPGLGSVYVQGLTLAEAKLEIDSRYAHIIPGVTVTVDLTQRAPRFLYVVGHVEQPGRFDLQGPTTAMQAIALAGGWRNGANLRQVVVFRRADDWRLMATMLDLRGALYARRPTPADEIWLSDSDIVLVPQSPIEVADQLIEQIFTRGIYSAVPVELLWGQGFGSVSSIGGF